MDEVKGGRNFPSLNHGEYPENRESILIKLWLRSYESINTQKAYERYLKLFTSTMRISSLKEVRVSHVNVFLRLMLAKRSRKTVSLYKAVLGSAFSYLESVEYIPSNPVTKSEKISVPKNSVYKIFSSENAQEMIDVALGLDKTLVLLLYYTMARISEIINLKLADVIVDTQWANIKLTGKGNKIRRVKIPIKIWEMALESALEERGQLCSTVINPHEPLFISSRQTKLSRTQAWRRYKNVAAKAGLPKQVAPHWSRHSSITHALKRGASLKGTSEMAGHGSTEITVWYQNIDDDTPPSGYL